MPNISYIGISAIYCSILLCLYLLTTNFIIIRFYSFISMAILLIILLKSLGTAVCCFLNKHLNEGFRSEMFLNIISVLTIITLFYNVKL
jgi:hypothetical protein